VMWSPRAHSPLPPGYMRCDYYAMALI